jgi:D-arginine dehydrogenase
VTAPQLVDVAVIGGGMAGAAAAWWTAAEDASVVLLEAEASSGLHSTGRSAAVLTTTTGTALVRRLTAECRPFFVDPPAEFAEVPLARPRAVLRVGVDEPWPGTERLSAAAARRLVPVLRDGTCDGAVLEADGLDIDVDALLQGFLRGLRRRGGDVLNDARVQKISRRGRGWRVEHSSGVVDTAVIVDAAGAWADEIAQRAGVPSVGLQPTRRTAFLFRAPSGLDASSWPLIMDGAERWYVKPDAGLLLGSGADETPTEPCDARPEEIDVATGIHRITEALDLEIRSVHRAWAGLRTFAPDRDPVVGSDAQHPGFVWLAGQGGSGIKLAPVLGRLAADAALGRPTPPELSRARFGPKALSA